MKDRCQREIIELHQFFQDWFAGALPATDENFERVAGVLNEDFALISPNGKLSERMPLLVWLRDSHGSRQNFRLWIEQFRLHRQEGPVALVTYQEWQETEEGQTVRLSTALFREKANTPNGLEWLHVHETWLPNLSPGPTR